MDNKMSTKIVIIGSFIAIVILIVAQVLAGLIASGFSLVKLPEGICNIIAGVLYLGLAYLFLQLLIKKVFKNAPKEFGIPSFHIKGRWLIVAVLLPLVVKMIYLLAFEGEYISSGMNNSEIFSTLSAGIVFTGIAAGFVEEMVFRGIILNLLKSRWNTLVAVLVPSVLFGFVHILGMNFSIGSCLLVLLAGTMVGIMFSMIALESGSVWNSGIVHAIWNIVIIGGGLSINQTADEYSVMTYVLKSKSFAFTGGEFGIESSVVSLLGYIVVTLIAIYMMKRAKNSYFAVGGISMLIETERLIITEFTMDMAQIVQENSVDEDNKRFVPDEVWESVEEVEETLEFLISQYGSFEGPLVYPIIVKKNNDNVGYVQLVPIEDGMWELGYHIAKRCTGNGYATEAVRAFLPVIAKAANLTEIYGICLAENKASVAVMEKCGFINVYSGMGLYQGADRDIIKNVWKM